MNITRSHSIVLSPLFVIAGSPDPLLRGCALARHAYHNIFTKHLQYLIEQKKFFWCFILNKI